MGAASPAGASASSGQERALVLLVEFTGTDVFTWTAPTDPAVPSTGSQWDPYGKIDSSGSAIPGDCSSIITQTTKFSYTGPFSNTIERPRSAADASGTSIWSPGFSQQWFKDYLFGSGVVISYTRQDGSPVHESFIGKSLKDFYSDASNGAYTLDGDVFGWLSVPHSGWYYGADECPGGRSGGTRVDGAIKGAGSPDQLVRDALQALNAISKTIPAFSWQDYDQNKDGIIDRLWIVHAGYGEEDDATLLGRAPTAGSFYGEAALQSRSSALDPAYTVAPGVAVAQYIILPENGGIGVGAHVLGLNGGGTDLAASAEGSPSSGFWSAMGDYWTGYPLAFEPPALDPWHLDNWGWLDPLVITDTSKIYTVTLGQASHFTDNTAPGPDPAYRGVRIGLATGHQALAPQPWQGHHYWWGGQKDLADAMMTSRQAIAIPASGATLSFQTAYELEKGFDYLWVQVSTDGKSWATLKNSDTTCTHGPGWIGGEKGMEGKCGFTGRNGAFPNPDTEGFSLTPYKGRSIYLRFWYMTDWNTTAAGPFVDGVQVATGQTTLFAADAGAGAGKWTYALPWVISDGTAPFSQNYYLQWRNVNQNGGYDAVLGDPRFRYGPANSGLLIWYNNNYYANNQLLDHMFDYPSAGAKGRLLLIDSHPDPYREAALAADYNNEASNVATRALMRDAPFTLAGTVDFTMTNTYLGTSYTAQYPGRAPVNEFDDAFGWNPGAEFVPGGPVGQTAPRWMTRQWDAGVVVPSQARYSVKAPSYTGDQRFRFDCILGADGKVLCYTGPGANGGLGYDGGNGNPGDVNGQYGWHTRLLQEGPDHTWAKVVIWNDLAYQAAYAPAAIDQAGTHVVTYTLDISNDNYDRLAETHVFTYTLDPALTYVDCGLALDGVQQACAPALSGSARVWSVTLQPGVSASFVMTASLEVAYGSDSTLNTALTHADSLNPAATQAFLTDVRPRVSLYMPLVR
jgi:immune inhibitor A